MSCQRPTLKQKTDKGKGERQIILATWICRDLALNNSNDDDVVDN